MSIQRIEKAEIGSTRRDQLLRFLGTSLWLPRKLRSFVVRLAAGDEVQIPGFAYELQLFNKTYFGHTSSHVDWHVYFFGTYDPLGTSLLRNLAKTRKPAVALDVGANTGTHTLAMYEYCQEVHCFEPFEPVRMALNRNIEANNLANVCVYAFGLSDQTCSMQFCPGGHGNHGAGRYASSPGDSINLPVHTGDGVVLDLNLERIDLIKVDVEGHEFNVFRGLSESLKRYRPIVQWECNVQDTTLLPCDVWQPYFPDRYETFRISSKHRWNRQSPILRKFDRCSRGNLLSVPLERMSDVTAFLP
ncbi:FkbM family methyltransferase [Fuerstiella marisgermanici]|uniref:Methyltransferase, FkbM family n=1 Tax=Fuerstiella marisgermanici TaxID=1891926 RepID=A0A1P8WPE1_9PLAN|nr:FkbM family methyltransferase [Fuerstiella marisgermanici]APZ95926.1 methyltransferase, FkbM family [Fuerstiella marisgermanici]